MHILKKCLDSVLSCSGFLEDSSDESSSDESSSSLGGGALSNEGAMHEPEMERIAAAQSSMEEHVDSGAIL